MKNFLKMLNFFAILLVMMSCSGDDDGSNSNGLDNIPSGEIVAVEERQQALTGFSEEELDSEGQKWWTHVVSDVEVSGPEECGEDVTIRAIGFIAFFTNGSLYIKTSKESSEVFSGNWEWVDSSKEAVYVSNALGNQEFTLTYLNEDNIVYGSVQSAGSCSAITYEEFNDPYFE